MENFMKTLTALAAALTVSALIAAPASAADLRVASANIPFVRVSVTGKPAAQVEAEINAAAAKVCTDARGLDSVCQTEATRDAQDQLHRITSTHLASASTPVKVTRQTTSMIRVSLDGKSPTQIDNDISAAAQVVCKEVSNGQMDYLECTKAAISDAKDQLRSARLDQPTHRATN
jgi:hypothetical protein